MILDATEQARMVRDGEASLKALESQIKTPSGAVDIKT